MTQRNYEIPPDLDSEYEPQIKFYTRKLIEGFILGSQGEVEIDNAIMNFLIARAKEAAKSILDMEKHYNFKYKGGDRQTIYEYIGIALGKEYIKPLGKIVVNLFTRIVVKIMPPQRFTYDILPGTRDVRIDLDNSSNPNIRFKVFLLEDSIDRAMYGVGLIIGFHEDFLIRKKYIQERES